MLSDARIENSRNPQVVIERLARREITDQEAEKLLMPLWERAYARRTVLGTIRSMLRSCRFHSFRFRFFGPLN